MDHWIALGIFLLGAGVGALATLAMYVTQIRQLKDFLAATHKNPRTEGQMAKSGQARVRLAPEVSGRE